MDLPGLIALETNVWEALQQGDAAADSELLADDFLGVYPTGFADRQAHVDQLMDGPTVASFSIHDARMIDGSEHSALLAYRAEYRRPGSQDAEEMYVSSLWVRRRDRWLNVFSQDTPVDPTAIVP